MERLPDAEKTSEWMKPFICKSAEKHFLQLDSMSRANSMLPFTICKISRARSLSKPICASCSAWSS